MSFFRAGKSAASASEATNSNNGYGDEAFDIAAALDDDAAVLEGELYYKKKGIFGQASWPLGYAKVTSETVSTWNSEKDYSKGRHPANVFHFNVTIIEEKPVRAHTFQLTDTSDRRSIELSALNINDYEGWLTFITSKQKNAMEKAMTQDFDDGIEIKPLEGDIILEYFHKYNVMADPVHPTIETARLQRLINEIDRDINGNILRFLLRDLSIHEGIISYEEFIKWWTEFKILKTSSGAAALDGTNFGLDNALYGSPSPVAALKQYKSTDTIHFTGIVDACAVQDRVDAKVLLTTKVPKVAKITGTWTYDAFEKTDWNEQYQSLVEDAACMYGEDSRDPSEGVDKHVGDCLALSAFVGRFTGVATSAVTTIVDEYPLPENMKTIKKVTISGDDPAGDRKPLVDEEVYASEGLLLRAVGVAASDSDRQPVGSQSAKPHLVEKLTFDEIRHKLCGREHRALVMMQKAVFAMYERHRRFVKSEDVPGGYAEEIVKPCTILSAVVDYSGFRFQVYCPVIDIDEPSTLVFGRSSQSEPRVFVNASPALRSCLPLLSQELNIAIATKTEAVSLQTLSEAAGSSDANLYGSSTVGMSERLCNHMQVHLCGDNRFYLFNYEDILPLDLPRSATHDALTRSLRPEFVQRSYEQSNGRGGGKIFADAFREDVQGSKAYLEKGVKDDANDDKDTVGTANDTEVNSEGYEDDASYAKGRRAARLQQERKYLSNADSPERVLLEVWQELYTARLVKVAAKLDFLCFMPLDSYSLTTFLHSEGASMHQLGALYNLSNIPFVKTALFCEAVGRACKSLLAAALRDASRRGFADAQAAVHRGRSSDRNFTDNVASVLRTKKNIVLDMFNTVLGSGKASEKFWSDVLAGAVFQKFGIDFGRVPDSRATVHFPYLFAALQYHSGALFKDRRDFAFNSLKAPEPLKAEDVLQYFTPKLKVSRAGPGHMGTVDSLADMFLGFDLPSDAIYSLNFRLSTLLLSSPNSRSLQHILAVGHNLYKLAYALYAQESYQTALETLHHYLSQYPKYSSLSARMMTLAMCIEAKLGNLPNVIKYFDSAQVVMLHVVGPHHPVHCVNMCALADIYCNLKCYKKASLMLQLARDLSKRVVGSFNMAGALYESKEAALAIRGEGDFGEGARLLSRVALVLDSVMAQGVRIEKDAADSLYMLALAAAHGGDTDFAINCATRSIEISAATEKRTAPPSVVACLVLLGDLFAKRSDTASAVTFYQDAWIAVKCHPGDYADPGSSLAAITGRMIAVHKTKLPLASRVLMDSVTDEVYGGYRHGVSAPLVWESVRDSIVSSLWTERTPEVVTRLVSAFQEHEANSNGDEEEKTAGSFAETDKMANVSAASKLAISIAIVNKLSQAN